LPPVKEHNYNYKSFLLPVYLNEAISANPMGEYQPFNSSESSVSFLLFFYHLYAVILMKNKSPGIIILHLMAHRFFLFTTVASLLLTACQPSPEPGQISGDVTQNKNGTAEMVRLLREVYETNILKNVSYFENSARADSYKAQIEQSTDPAERINLELYHGYELMNAGRNEEAIVVLETLRQRLASVKSVNSTGLYQLKRLLALSYFRLGEVANCVSLYNPDRCILPLEGRGIYELQSSIQTSISIFKEMLEQKPDDYEIIWMLNFAYMALGEFPERVPVRWRLDERGFKSDYQIPRFKEMAVQLKINTVGLAGGTCVDDFDNDGYIDILASSWGYFDQIHFYKNNGDGTFTDCTTESGLTGLTGGLNMVHADYNNDGYVDVLVLRGAWSKENGAIPNSLIKNNGDGTFTDATIEAGVLSYYPTQTAVWADFNLDGWLDLFIGNEAWNEKSQYPCELFMSNRDGTFTNRISESRLGSLKAVTKGVVAGDANNDGWPDLYLSYLNAGNRLFFNAGLYTDDMISFYAPPEWEKVSEPLMSFPCWFWDFNNDGWEDIFVAASGYGGEGKDRLVAAAVAAQNNKGVYSDCNPLIYLNNGDGTYKDITHSTGLKDDLFVMGSNYGDIDNDGWLDMYLGTGAPSYSAVVPNKMFRNNEGRTFQDVTTAGGLGHVQKGHGIGFADFDNDGDQDIYAVMGGAFEGSVFGNAFFLNPFGNEKSWVTLVLEGGVTSNRAAIGARVKIVGVNGKGKERAFYRTVSTGSSFGGNSLQLETGLDDAVSIKTIEVQWPNRNHTAEVFQNIEVKRFVKIKEGSGKVEYLKRKVFVF